MSAMEDLKRKLIDAVNEDPTISNIRSQYAALDTRSQMQIAVGFVAMVVIVFAVALFYVFSASLSARSKLNQANESMRYMKQTQIKMAELEKKIASQGKAPKLFINQNASPNVIFKQLAAQSNISEKNLEVTGTNAKLNKISIRQLVQFVYYIETAVRSFELSDLKIDARNNKQGYLWAEILLKAKSVASQAGGAAAKTPGKASPANDSQFFRK